MCATSLSVIVIGDHAYAVRGYRSGRTKGENAEANFQNTQAIPVLQKRSKRGLYTRVFHVEAGVREYDDSSILVENQLKTWQ